MTVRLHTGCSLLFGASEEDDSMDSSSDNAIELEHLKREAEELKALKASIESPDIAQRVFDKVFDKDIHRLLTMEDMWKTRSKPIPMSFTQLDTEHKEKKSPKKMDMDRDQKVWSASQSFHEYKTSLQALCKRLAEARKTDPEATLEFDKDDDDALDFVTATANLRATIFGIETLSRFKIKEMAGNIIPAIATTNAIIAGFIVLEAFKVLTGQRSQCRNPYLLHTGGTGKVIVSEQQLPPSDTCTVCRAGYFVLYIDTNKATLQDIVDMGQAGQRGDSAYPKHGLGLTGDITLQEGERLLYDPDFDDNAETTLASLGLTHGKRLMITNDDDEDPEANALAYVSIVHSPGSGEKVAWRVEGDATIPTRPVPTAPVEPATQPGGTKSTEVIDVDQVTGMDTIVLD